MDENLKIENASDIKPDDPWMKEDFWDRVFADYSLADDILNIPYIDSDNMDEYLKNLADRARKLEIKRDNIKRILNMQYGVPQVKFDTGKLKLPSIRPWGYDDRFEHNAVVKLVQPKQSINQDITEDEQVTSVKNKMIDDANRIIFQVKQDTENFIFETIQPWCESRIERKICKADLEQALLMYYSLDKVDPETTEFNKDEEQ